MAMKYIPDLGIKSKVKMSKKSSKKLEKKIWYRFIKVIYVTSYILAFLLVALLSYPQKPYTYADPNKSLIECANGRTYSEAQAGVSLYSLNSTDGSLLESAAREDQKIRKLCEYNIVSDYLNQYETPQFNNYTTEIKYSTSGSWESVIYWLIGGAIVVFIIFEIIRRVFLYVAVGKEVMAKEEVDYLLDRE